MKHNPMISVANALFANDQGILGMNGSNPTCNKRFAAFGIPQQTRNRVFILDAHTSAGIIPGIKGDAGSKDMATQASDDEVADALQALIHRAKGNHAARNGQYVSAMEAERP